MEKLLIGSCFWLCSDELGPESETCSASAIHIKPTTCASIKKNAAALLWPPGHPQPPGIY